LGKKADVRDDVMRRAPPVSEKKKRERGKGIPHRLGKWAVSGSRWNGPFHFFSSSFFYFIFLFLISFIPFAFWFQIDSNQFLKFNTTF
jgi:hypothetical protein